MSVSVIQSGNIPEDFPYSRWEILLSGRKTCSFFQTVAWSELLCSSVKNLRPFHYYFQFSDGTEAILPLLGERKKGICYKLESLPRVRMAD